MAVIALPDITRLPAVLWGRDAPRPVPYNGLLPVE